MTTAKVGAEPTEEKELDATPDSSTGEEQDAQPDSSQEKVPWDKDPRWTKFREKEKAIDTFMKENDFESIEELMEHVNEGRYLKGKLSGRDLDKIIQKAETLESYEEYWATEEERKRRDEELPEDTIKRLEQRLEAETKAKEELKKKQEEARAAERAVKSYEKEVHSMLKDSVDDDEAQFVKLIYGINNPLNTIDITDMKAVKKLVEDGLKKKQAYDQKVIQKYLNGKRDIPKIPSGSTATEPPVEIKSLKDARKTFKERMGQLMGG